MLAVAFLIPILWVLGGLAVGTGTAIVVQRQIDQQQDAARRKLINATSLIGGTVLAALLFFGRKKK